MSEFLEHLEMVARLGDGVVRYKLEMTAEADVIPGRASRVRSFIEYWRYVYPHQPVVYQGQSTSGDGRLSVDDLAETVEAEDRAVTKLHKIRTLCEDDPYHASGPTAADILEILNEG